MLESSGWHSCAASAMHSAHGYGSARRVLRYRPKLATASAEAAACSRAADTVRVPEGSARHGCSTSAMHGARGYGIARRVLQYRPTRTPASAGSTSASRKAARGVEHHGAPDGAPGPPTQKGTYREKATDLHLAARDSNQNCRDDGRD